MKHFIVGTAGHIDHGKSSLVQALTGVHPDRLSEEKQRGMTIDLGFAFLNENIAFIDVPGHEKFVKNMVAGVSTIDMVMLVVAADDSVMPQTREHLDILNLLNIQHGIIVITKIDLVDEELLPLIEEEIREETQHTFLKGAKIFHASSTKGTGINDIKNELLNSSDKLSGRKDRGYFWMPVDRSFSIKGFGTVVTGSVISGETGPNETLELLPQKALAKIRGVESHGKNVERIGKGNRAAINISNLTKDTIERGNVLATAGIFEASKLLDVKLELLKTAKPLKNRARVRFHHGTSEIMGRIKLLDVEVLEPENSCFAQILLEHETVALPREPFIIRQYSPQFTIGGGLVLNANTISKKRFDSPFINHLKSIEKQSPIEIIEEIILAQKYNPITLNDLLKATGFSESDIQQYCEELLSRNRLVTVSKKSLFHAFNVNNSKALILSELEAFHQKNPLRIGLTKPDVIQKLSPLSSLIIEHVLKTLISNKKITEKNQWYKLPDHKISFNEEQEKLAQHIESILLKAKYEPPTPRELADELNNNEHTITQILMAMVGSERLEKCSDYIYFPKQTMDSARTIAKELVSRQKEFTLLDFKDKIQASRKFTLAILEYFDATNFTERIEDIRILK